MGRALETVVQAHNEGAGSIGSRLLVTGPAMSASRAHRRGIAGAPLPPGSSVGIHLRAKRVESALDRASADE
jgi:hypothetical protein